MEIKTFSRLIFHVTEFEKKLRRKNHYNLSSPNADRIWTVSESFFHGYNLALNYHRDFKALQEKVDQVEANLRGFAYEGIGTALTLLDIIYPWSNGRLDKFIKEYGFHHIKTTYAGVGLAYARLGLSIEKRLPKLNNENQEFALDGWSFFKGCLANKDYSSLKAPTTISPYLKDVFYRGLGRSLWFKVNGQVQTATNIIQNIEADHKVPYWTGFGIACAYAGKLDEENKLLLLALEEEYISAIEDGFAIAKYARKIGGIEWDYTSNLTLKSSNNKKDSSDATLY